MTDMYHYSILYSIICCFLPYILIDLLCRKYLPGMCHQKLQDLILCCRQMYFFSLNKDDFLLFIQYQTAIHDLIRIFLFLRFSTAPCAVSA